MALRGTVKACCPKGCEPTDVEVWSFVRGDTDEQLREALLGGELNLVVCEDCGEMFYPEAIVVYYDPREELLGFVFPESYRAERARWQKKMRADYEQMREALGAAPTIEPEIFFGTEELRLVIQEDELLEAEVQVAEHVAEGSGIGFHRVRRDWARTRHVPRLLPYAGGGGAYSRAAAEKGVAELLALNDRLAGFARWPRVLADAQGDPPTLAAAPRKAAVKPSRREAPKERAGAAKSGAKKKPGKKTAGKSPKKGRR